MTRFAYCGSIVIMVIAIHDGQVTTGESVVLVLGYVGYVTFMFFNEKFMRAFCHKPEDDEGNKADVELGLQSKEKGMSMDLER